MVSVSDIYAALDRRAPVSIQLDFDNAGFLVGRGAAEVKRVLVALDVTAPAIREAVALNAQLIVAHHPVIWGGAKSVTDADPTGRRLLALIENGIAAICMHTNLDAAAGGVNAVLAERLGLCRIEQLHADGTGPDGSVYGIGRVGELSGGAVPLADFLQTVKRALGADALRACDGGRPVSRVAVGGGACGGMLADALRCGCDTFVTADVKYDVFLEAVERGVNLIDAGHYFTECIVLPVLADWLKTDFPQLDVRLSAQSCTVFGV